MFSHWRLEPVYNNNNNKQSKQRQQKKKKKKKGVHIGINITLPGTSYFNSQFDEIHLRTRRLRSPDKVIFLPIVQECPRHVLKQEIYEPRL